MHGLELDPLARPLARVIEPGRALADHAFFVCPPCLRKYSRAELAHVLATSRKDDFYRCLTGKLLTYAIGRGLEYYDTVTVEKIVSDLNASDGAMRSVIYGIVESAPFQKRRGDGTRVANRD